MFGRRQAPTLEQRLAAASSSEIFELLDENLRDKSSFGRFPSVQVSELDSAFLVRSAEYEQCIAACQKLPSQDRLNMARRWATEFETMRRIAAADILAVDPRPDDPAQAAMLEIVVAIAGDQETSVVIAALDAFWYFKNCCDPGALRRIQAACEQHPDRAIRWNFVRSFPDGGHDLSALIRLTNDLEPRIRIEAVAKLAEAFPAADQPTRQSIRTALAARRDDPDPMARLNAGEAMKQIGAVAVDRDESAGHRIARALSTPNGGFDIVAASQLSSEDAAALRAYERKASRAVVSAMLENADNDVRERFETNGAGDRQRAQDAGLLSLDDAAAEAAEPPPGFDLRLAAATVEQLFDIIVMAQRCRPCAHIALNKAIETCHGRPSDELRQATDAWARTRDMSNDRNLDIVHMFLGPMASEAISRQLQGKAPRSDDVSVLIRQLHSDDEETVIEALRGLNEHMSRPRDAALLKLMEIVERHRNENIRMGYAGLFAEPETDAEIATLLRLADDPAHLVRNAACEGLANRVPETGAIREAIAAFLGDEHIWIRRRAISILAERADYRLVDAISAELRADDATIESIVEYDPVDLWQIIQKVPRQRFIGDLMRWQNQLTANDNKGEFILKAIDACRQPGVAQ